MISHGRSIVVAINLAVLGAAVVSFFLIRSAMAQTATTSPAEVATTTAEVATSNSTPTTIVDLPLSQLREVHIIGTKYTDYFTDGTTVFTFPGDADIHATISKPNAPIPTREGLTWDHSAGTHLYDTPSGDLEIGTFALQPNGSYVAHLATTTIENATSTPFLPARVVVLQERPATATPAPAAASEQDPLESNTPAVFDSGTSAQPETSPSNASGETLAENSASTTATETAPEPPVQTQEIGQVLGTTTEQNQTSQGDAPTATSSSEAE